MTYYKWFVVLFGGFQDTSQQTKYLADLWIYDTQNFIWHNPVLPLATMKPDARSSFSFLPHDSGAVLYGGYSRVKATLAGKQMKGGGQSQRNVLKPVIHQDCFFLRILQPPVDAQPQTPPNVRWERRKRPANPPNPPRAGATMVHHRGRGILFGGVHDVEESEEGINSEFFNGLFAWNFERNRFFPLSLRRPRISPHKPQANERGNRRGRGQANEDELLRNLAALETGKSLDESGDICNDQQKFLPTHSELPTKRTLMELPHPRFNAQLAVQGDVLFIYGGTFEKGDREYTFDEMYAVDLGKLDGVDQIFRREPDNWLGSDNEESVSEDDSEESDDEDDIHEDSWNTTMVDEVSMHSDARICERKKRAGDDGDIDSEVSAPIYDSSGGTFDDTPDESTSTATADDRPCPRPFESRRDFFQRTGNEWQELLITSLRWNGIQPEAMAVKEIKSRAFDMSEEKWWDCREEIIALEDEQEAAGIGEVITLADRGETLGVAGRRR
jgi:hypothetical protein